MRKNILLFFILIPFISTSQGINIYTNWVAKADNNTIFILDLSSGYTIGLKQIKIIDDVHYRVNSVGYKRKFNSIFLDIDSTLVSWSGYFEPLHLGIESEMLAGQIKVLQRNYRGIPERISFTGELPGLSLYLDSAGSIEFSRMQTTDNEGVEYVYNTYYGGKVSYKKYTDGHDDYSMGIYNVGMKFVPLQLNRVLLEKFNEYILQKANAIRKDNETEKLEYDQTLDTSSLNTLKVWLKDINKYHRLDSFPDFTDAHVQCNSVITDQSPDLKLIHYPFQCGVNAVAIMLQDQTVSDEKKFKEYLTSKGTQIFDKVFADFMNHSGDKQNLINSGYATTGYSMMALESKKDDFYFNENGNRMNVQNDKTKYYCLLFVQSFSVYEKSPQLK